MGNYTIFNRMFTVLYFSVRSSRSGALRYGLPILHECQNYLGGGGGGGLGGSEKSSGGETGISRLLLPFINYETPLVMKNMPDTFSIDYACSQISPFETVIL